MAVADLIIRLKDQASSGLDRIGGLMGKLGSRAVEAAGQTESLTNAILKANAITYAVSKATEAVGFLQNKFSEATNLQLEQINQVTTLSTLIGVSSQEATKFIDSFNNRLAKSAATLPGVTGDYLALSSAITDNVVGAFKDATGKVDMKGFEDSLASISETYGARTAASTKDIQNTSLGLSKALAGASVNELRQIAFFEQNPVILNEIESRLSSMGKELKDLDVASRVKLIQEVGEKFITTEFKKSASESVDGLIQGFMTTLFDPRAGVFGIMRDLDPATDGAQSAFKSLNDALLVLIGSDGIFFQMSEILMGLGIGVFDPMQAIATTVNTVTAGLKRVNEGLAYIKDFVKAGGDLGDTIRLGASLLSGSFGLDTIASNFSDFMFSVGDRIESFLSTVVAQAAPLFNRGVAMVSEYFADPAKFAQMGVAFGSLLGRVAGQIVSFLSRVDYPQLLIGIGRVAIAIGAAILGAIGGFGAGILPGIGDAVGNIGRVLWDGLTTIFLAVRQNIIDGLNLAVLPIKTVINQIPGIGRIVTTIIDAQLGAFEALISGGIGGLFRYITDMIRGVVMTAQTTLGSIVNQARNIPVVGQFIPQATPSPVVGQFLPQATPSPVGAIASRYDGQIGWAAGGFLGDLLGAAQREMSRMPAGANLMMANSSETIIPQGMLGGMLNGLLGAIAPPLPALALPAPSAAGGGSTVNLTVNINGTSGDPGAIAQEVINRIQSLFESELKATF